MYFHSLELIAEVEVGVVLGVVVFVQAEMKSYQ